MNNNLKRIGILISVLLAGGCQILGARIATGAGAMPAYEPLPERDYDAAPQIIYAIDNHRFFTSENYEKCSVGHVYYNDTDRKIKTPVGWALATFPGMLHLDGNLNTLVFPSAPANGIGRCGNEKGCTLQMYYSLDGGKTFDRFHTWELGSDLGEAYEKNKHITVNLQGLQLYIANQDQAYVYTLQKGIKGGAQYIEGGPKNVPHVRTPSGQDHLTCDDSIRPKEIKK